MWRSQYEICRRNTKLMGSLLCLMKKKGEKERCSLREKWVTNDSPDTNAAVTVLSNSVHLPLWKQPSLPLFFFHLKYSLYPALSVIPFCKMENHLLSSVSLYLKKKNHNAQYLSPLHFLISSRSPFLTLNVINTLLFFYPETEILKCLNIFRTCQSVCLIRIHREKKEEDIFLKTGLHRSSWSSTLNTTMKSLSQFKERN